MLKRLGETMSSPPATLFKQWVHSQEEDTPDVRVYRPAGYPLPRVRGREGFFIGANGEFSLIEIAPTNGWQSETGRWEVRGEDTIVVQFDDPLRPPLMLCIVACDEKELKIDRRFCS
jgi:hypothetical protein